MAKNKESKTLNQSLDAQMHPEIQANLENLKGLGLDPELFAQFERRITQIIGENPGSEEVVAGELEKTGLSVEALFSNYDRRFRSILDHAANDDLYSDAA
ncbi:MAG: hypothetical protein AB7E37_05300 [Candidatus Altimarinota bacterium]